MDFSSYITGFSDAVSSIKSLGTSITSFFTNISNVFIYLPASMWVLILAALALIIVLRILGR
jgi:hypothetical protein